MADKALLELAEDLEKAAGDVRETRGKEQLRARVERVASEFSLMAQGIEPVSRFLSECVDNHIIDHFPPIAPDLHQRLLELARDATTEPEKVVDAEDLGGLRSRISSIRTNWETTASAAWQDYCRSSIPARQGAILRLLEDLQGPTDAIAEIERLDRLLAQVSATVPMDTRGGPALLVKSLADRRVLWNSLNVEQIPDEVMAFINATASGGAPLRLLTAEVLAWLSNRGLLDNYSVVGGSRND